MVKLHPAVTNGPVRSAFEARMGCDVSRRVTASVGSESTFVKQVLQRFLLLTATVLIVLSCSSCTMFLIKEGIKEIKKLNEEHKQKEQQKAIQDDMQSRQYGQ